LSVDQPVSQPVPSGASRYFLHVHKCGGTAAAITAANGFAVSACFSPYAGAYYPDEFLHHPARHDRVEFYVGHFAWEVPAAFPEGEVRVTTLLRHPVDRMLSYFHYLLQHRRVSKGRCFEDWVRSDMRFENTMTRQFIAGAVFDENTGAEAILASAQSVLAEALGNLRRCVVVGLTEEMDDSINLFANELGFLAPQKLARYNKTESRSDVASLTPTFLSALEHWLAPDFALYEEAQAIFKLHRATLQAKLFGDQTERTSEQIRLEQRRRHLKRYMDEASLNRMLIFSTPKAA
jgi:hypothetical protein